MTFARVVYARDGITFFCVCVNGSGRNSQNARVVVFARCAACVLQMANWKTEIPNLPLIFCAKLRTCGRWHWALRFRSTGIANSVGMASGGAHFWNRRNVSHLEK